MPALIALALGITVGLASGGTLGGLARSSMRWGWLVLLLFALQAVARGRLLGMTGWSGLGIFVWSACSIGVAGILLFDWRVPGTVVAAVGMLVNVMVVLLNGGMPVGRGPSGQQLLSGHLNAAQRIFYHPVGQHSLGEVFGDVIPIRVAGSVTMLSVGDALLMVGVFAWVVGNMVTVPVGED